jgi:uncharacterized protein YdeI (YjbR/CyaY-like superfamily)
MKTEKKDIDLICPSKQSEWRNWLEQNHATASAVWLVYFKKQSGKNTISWSQAVDEAICFGWIDSTAKPIDDETYKQLFTKRNPKSAWSKINKDKVARLIEAELIAPSGLKAIEIAKQNGSWIALDEVEALIIPEDLEQQFQLKPEAKNYFMSLSNSNKKFILQWVSFVKRPETRLKRINEIIEATEQSKKPKILG